MAPNRYPALQLGRLGGWLVFGVYLFPRAFLPCALQTDCTNLEKNDKVRGMLTQAGLVEVHTQQCRNTFYVHRAFLPKKRAKAGGSTGG